MQRTAGQAFLEEVLVDWVRTQPVVEPRLPVSWLSLAESAAELGRIQRSRAQETAREAEVILRIAELSPEDGDLPPQAPGARRDWHQTAPAFPGVSEFFPDQVAHAINLGRGTAAFRARRAVTWRDHLPQTFAALRRGQLDERRAGVLADVLAHIRPELAQAVQARLLAEAVDLSPSRLRRRALELLADLDAHAAEQRHEQATRAADVFVEARGNGMATIGAELPAEQAAQIFNLIDQIATMTKADGDSRPIRQIRTEVFWQLLSRPGGTGRPAVQTKLTVHATLESLEGTLTQPGDVEGFLITAGQLRTLLHRVGALGLHTPEGGELLFALADETGRLIATVTPAELVRRTRRSQGLNPPPGIDRYQPNPEQRRLISTRDRTCRMPNCGQRVGWADLDHVLAHAYGGQTTCPNLCCLCRHDHRLKTHAPGWRFVLDDDGTLHVTSPAGITRTTRPPGLRPPDPEPPPPAEPNDDPPRSDLDIEACRLVPMSTRRHVPAARPVLRCPKTASTDM